MGYDANTAYVLIDDGTFYTLSLGIITLSTTKSL